jgi:mycothione reductase
MPKSITIVGGGYIACELGHFFHGVDVDTLMVVRGSQLLDREAAKTRAVFMKGFTERVAVTSTRRSHRLRTTARCFTSGVQEHSTGRARESPTAMALTPGVTVKRCSSASAACQAATTSASKTTDLKPTARGYIETDEHLRTPVEGVYAMGDIAGRYMFTHAANFESEYLGNQIAESPDQLAVFRGASKGIRIWTN